MELSGAWGVVETVIPCEGGVRWSNQFGDRVGTVPREANMHMPRSPTVQGNSHTASGDRERGAVAALSVRARKSNNPNAHQ